jgi:hypothetical protein
MFTTKPTLLASLFILFVSMQTHANNSQVTKVIAETAEQVSPLMNDQQIPSAIEVTTIEGEKLSLGKVLNNKKTILFFTVGVGAHFVIHKWDSCKK